jgi:hypothetical protein
MLSDGLAIPFYVLVAVPMLILRTGNLCKQEKSPMEVAVQRGQKTMAGNGYRMIMSRRLHFEEIQIALQYPHIS